MDVRVTSDAKAFEQAVFPFLQQDPVLHTIIMSNVHERAAGSYRAEAEPSYFVAVHDESGALIGAAMRTPNRPVYLGALRTDLAGVVATAYLELVPEPGGVSGDSESTRCFADTWAAARGVTVTEGRASRLHRLEDLTLLAADDGHARLMKPSEVELVANWSADGFSELNGPDLDWAESHLREKRMWIWEAGGEPVSMVGYHLPIFGVCRVGPVYTPPEHRRHGYAGALTAHVSGEILAQGNQACLFTDLANPTSNKIYYQAGYRPVADFVDRVFTT
jgi:hypothetical protein